MSNLIDHNKQMITTMKVTLSWADYIFIVQWAPLNGITDNGINQFWDQILLIWQIPKYNFLPNACLVNWVKIINRLLESVSICPKVNPLNGTHINSDNISRGFHCMLLVYFLHYFFNLKNIYLIGHCWWCIHNKTL